MSTQPVLTRDNFYWGGMRWLGYQHWDNLGDPIMQDNFYLIEKDDFIIGMISDGAGAGKNSQFGSAWYSSNMAHLYSQYLGKKTLKNITSFYQVYTDLLQRTRTVYEAFSYKAGSESLVATLGGIVIDFRSQNILTFSVGDGVILDNGKILKIDNKITPRSPFYASMINPDTPVLASMKEASMQPDFLKIRPLSKVRTVAIGSDGWFNGSVVGTDLVGDGAQKYLLSMESMDEPVEALQTQLKKRTFTLFDDSCLFYVRRNP